MGSEYSWAVDALIIVLIVVSAYLAMVRGFFRELFALASWVVAFFAAFFLAPVVHPHLAGLPGLGDFVESCDIGLLVAFVLVFGAALIIAGLVIWLFSAPSRNSAVSVIDQLLGLLYGALRGLVLVAVLIIVYQEFVRTGGESYDVVEAAASYPYVEQEAQIIRSTVPEDMPAWVDESLETMKRECEAAKGGVVGGTGA